MAHLYIPENADDVELSFIRPGHSPANVTLGGQALARRGQAWRRNGPLGPGLHEILADGIDRELGLLLGVTTAQSRGNGQGNRP